MIQALLHHKSHIRLVEDEKTSIIIGTLLHLPTTLMFKIIFDAVEDNPFALRDVTEVHLLRKPEFWPHWSTENIQKKNFVEPDVFMRFSSFDLIIEAKRNDDETSQYSDQLNNELIAYENKYGEKNKEVHLIALGGYINDIESINEKRRDKILTCSWYNLFCSIERKKERLQEHDEIYRILSDCKDAFEIFGYATGWLYELCDLEYKPINKESIENIKLWKI